MYSERSPLSLLNQCQGYRAFHLNSTSLSAFYRRLLECLVRLGFKKPSVNDKRRSSYKENTKSGSGTTLQQL